MNPSRRLLALAGAALAALFLAFQFVPYGRAHDNPPASLAAAWDSPRTESLAQRACLDCHSHQTRWPWYSNIAPISWRIQKHVEEGRAKFNVSAMDRPENEAGEAAETVEKGEMPPFDYVLAHPEARLTPSEKQDLIRGLAATFGREEGEGRGKGSGRRGGSRGGDRD